jgi:hypothetical protein
MPLSVGDKLSPCENLAAVGAGRMVEVYKANDMRLDRIVAFKLSSEFSERLESEARALAARILLRANGVQVKNFGSARQSGEGHEVDDKTQTSELTRAGAAMGTPASMERLPKASAKAWPYRELTGGKGDGFRSMETSR